MTRFNISLQGGVDMVIRLRYAWGGEIFIPKIPSYRITDVAEAIASIVSEIVGIRPGEKIHEEMITSSIHFTLRFRKIFYNFTRHSPMEFRRLQKSF